MKKKKKIRYSYNKKYIIHGLGLLYKRSTKKQIGWSGFLRVAIVHQ
jgi:hypothetical protein